MAWFYFVRPLESLAQNWQVKLPLAVVLAYVWELIQTIFGVYADLLALPGFLLGMASLAFIFDFLSAVVTAYRKNGIEGIELIKFRQLLIKASYWAIVIGAASNIATGAEEAGIPVFPQTDAAVVFWLTLQDGYSALQNWRGKEGAREWIKGALDVAQGDASIDSIVTDGNGQ